MAPWVGGTNRYHQFNIFQPLRHCASETGSLNALRQMRLAAAIWQIGRQQMQRSKLSPCVRATAQHRLAITPFSFRKAARNPAQRELIIPFGGTGYIALYEIVSASKVIDLTVRHQREEDYH
jgi:hypothetical protein